MLLSSTKFAPEAKKLLSLPLSERPDYLRLPKFQGQGSHEQVTLEGEDPGKAGMMLYTSGTTARPVSLSLPVHPLMCTDENHRKASSYPKP